MTVKFEKSTLKKVLTVHFQESATFYFNRLTVYFQKIRFEKNVDRPFSKKRRLLISIVQPSVFNRLTVHFRSTFPTIGKFQIKKMIILKRMIGIIASENRFYVPIFIFLKLIGQISTSIFYRS